MQRNSLRYSSLIMRTLFTALLWMGLSASAFAQSQYYPTYTPGPLGNDTWVVGNGQIITPAGTMVNLMVNESSGTGVRAKAIALNPVPLGNGHYTAAVLTMGATATFGPVQVFDVTTGTVLQSYYGFKDSTAARPASCTRRMASICCTARTVATSASPT